MVTNPVRIALVGCGQIADAHLQEIRRIPGAQVVALCDRFIDLARQAAVRFGVDAVYTDLGRMLAEQKPDVVHVTTPPHSHHAIVAQCLLAGSHVYVEKPFTVTLAEAEHLVGLAESVGRQICLGHDQLFDPSWQECRALAASGALGDIVHVEAVQGYDLDGAFGRLLATDPNHWVHQLPGGVFQNVMSHATARILDFLPDNEPTVHARWFTNGSQGFPTELRAMLIGGKTTGSLMFTSASRPVQKIARVFGTKMAVEVDLDARTVRRFRTASMPGGFAKVQLSWWAVRESAAGWRRNLRRLRACDLGYFSGMHGMFTAFYRSVREGAPMPLSHAEAIRATAVMESIFEACGSVRETRQPSLELAAI